MTRFAPDPGVGLAFKLKRITLGLHQCEVAYRIGISPSILSAVERGWRRPCPELVRRIEEALAEAEASR